MKVYSLKCQFSTKTGGDKNFDTRRGQGWTNDWTRAGTNEYTKAHETQMRAN